MSEQVSQLLELFDTLSEPDQRLAFVEILRRSSLGEADIPPITHDAMAAELFAVLDAEETANASDL
ncbi:hypothetical protein BH10PLA2_BH10PLA2_14120 [soil metagenome]